MVTEMTRMALSRMHTSTKAQQSSLIQLATVQSQTQSHPTIIPQNTTVTYGMSCPQSNHYPKFLTIPKP